MNRSKKVLVLLLAAIMVFAMTACSGSSDDPGKTDPGASDPGASDPGTNTPPANTENEKITLTIGGGHPSNTMSYASVGQSFFQDEVKRRCAEEANLDVEWVEAYGGTVAGLEEDLVATQNGLIDVRVGTFSFEPKKLLLMNLPFYVPFATSDPIITTKVARTVYDQFADVYNGLWEKYNQKFLGFGPTGDYELWTKFDVKTLADLKNKKIGGAPTMLRWIQNLGVVTVQSNFNEAYTNLQTGVYEGYIAWPDASEGYKFYEQAPYMIKTNFGSLAIQGISINIDTWNKLSEAAQKVFTEVGRAYEEKSAQTALDWDAEALENMTTNFGVKIIELDDATFTEVVNKCDNLPKMWIEEATADGFPAQDIMEAYFKAMEDNGVEIIRDWLNS